MVSDWEREFEENETLAGRVRVLRRTVQQLMEIIVGVTGVLDETTSLAEQAELRAKLIASALGVDLEAHIESEVAAALELQRRENERLAAEDERDA